MQLTGRYIGPSIALSANQFLPRDGCGARHSLLGLESRICVHINCNGGTPFVEVGGDQIPEGFGRMPSLEYPVVAKLGIHISADYLFQIVFDGRII